MNVQCCKCHATVSDDCASVVSPGADERWICDPCFEAEDALPAGPVVGASFARKGDWLFYDAGEGKAIRFDEVARGWLVREGLDAKLTTVYPSELRRIVRNGRSYTVRHATDTASCDCAYRVGDRHEHEQFCPAKGDQS